MPPTEPQIFPPLPGSPPTKIFSHLHGFESCLILRIGLGPKIPTLQRSQNGCTFWKSIIFLETSSLQHYMVGRYLCPSTCAYLVHLVHYPRDCGRSVLPVYGRIAQSSRPHRKGHQVGTRGPHSSYVLGCDHDHWNWSQPSISRLYRQPGISQQRRICPWTLWVQATRLHQANQPYSQ